MQSFKRTSLTRGWYEKQAFQNNFLTDEKIQDFSRTFQDPHEKFFKTFFGPHEYLNIKKKRNPRPEGSRAGDGGGVFGQGSEPPRHQLGGLGSAVSSLSGII